MASQSYLLRFCKKLLVEIEGFLTGQQMITALLLALGAFYYQYKAGRLTLDALRDNTASVVFPFVWVVCSFGCYYIIKAAVHLHREMAAEVAAYKPAVPEFVPKRPSTLPGVLAASGSIAVLALLSYGAFATAFSRPSVPPPIKTPSFVYVAPGVLGFKMIPTGGAQYSAQYMWAFHVLHSGTEPSYNVTLLFVDDVAREQVGRKAVLTPDDTKRYQLLLKFPEVDAYGRGNINPLNFPWTTPRPGHEKYHVTLTWRDGSIYETLEVEKVGEKWLYAMSLKDNETNQLLVDCKDNGFPSGPSSQYSCFPKMMRPLTLAHIPDSQP